ncbi:MAG TPA: PH domain-containing protein [Verrucomicrobiota bacterium]|nr:hypothetical protein [Verrucomicrobiales bacterium]HRI12617.1 PH domain-containing protein [Verrucomicrobiota bacterium]
MSDSAIQFRAPLGPSVKLLTALAYFVLLGVGAGSAAMLALPPVPRVAAYVGLGTVILIAVVSWVFRIHGYSLDEGRLIIRYGFSGRAVPFSDITAVELAQDVFRGAWRVFASGGLWSFLGRFQSSRLGPFLAYVSDPARTVLISTAQERVIISPEDPAKFVGELQRRLTRTS